MFKVNNKDTTSGVFIVNFEQLNAFRKIDAGDSGNQSSGSIS